MDVDNECLIAAVQKVQALYDKSHKFYSNRQFANQAWKNIGQELNIDANVARRKWTNLRDYFQRTYRQTMASKSGSARCKKRKWALYDAMVFLVPFINEGSALGSASDVSDSESEGNETKFDCSALFPPPSFAPGTGSSRVASTTRELESPHSDATSMLLHYPQTPTLQASTASTSMQLYSQYPDTSRAAVQTDFGRQTAQTLKHVSTNPYVPPRRENEEEGEDLLFFKSLVPKMRHFSDVQKMELQGEIHSVFLKHLKRAQGVSTSCPLGHEIRPEPQ